MVECKNDRAGCSPDRGGGHRSRAVMGGLHGVAYLQAIAI